MINEYDLLNAKVKKWIYNQGWSDLRDIQKRSIKPILKGDCDVLISAATAAGKTEAFFLPACSAIVDKTDGFGILYLSPLKALINDQYRRLNSLCDLLEMDITPWHGDIAQSKKKKAKNHPSGILLTTPESLESLLIRDPGWVKYAFSSLKYIVIDEFHAFIGTERGQQLLSLLTRLEHILGRLSKPIPRIALSATLGEIERVPLSLRPNQSLHCEIIEDVQSVSTVKIQIKGYIDPCNNGPEDTRPSADSKICMYLFDKCRGNSHLVFANSRKRTEAIAAQLSDYCEEFVVPNEFFPHHGSLAKEIREALESRLQKETLPTTAICTMTLELGIDIGKVESVFQVTAPHSVSSLRQRLGRSGRRNNPSILRVLIPESEIIKDSNIVDLLRIELVQSMAMMRLLIADRWFEPAETNLLHLSTLVHQILAIIAQWGGVQANQLYSLLCIKGPFNNITITNFKILLKGMGESDLILQLPSGELILGVEGERLVNQYTFYAVFKTPQEFRIIAGTKTLGTLPVDSLILKNQHIIFGGRRWFVIDVDIEKKVIRVKETKGGKPPKFGGGGISIHDAVRQEMYKIYCEQDYRIKSNDFKVDFADGIAKNLFEEGATYFKQFNLESSHFIEHGKAVYIFTWLGDKVVNTITTLLQKEGFTTCVIEGVIEIRRTSIDEIKRYFKSVLKNGIPNETELAEFVPEKKVQKYDDYLPEELLNQGYGLAYFDCKRAKQWLIENI